MKVLADRGPSSRRGGVLLAVMVIASLCIAPASPAQAHVPYLADTWGSNLSGQLGDGIEEGPQQCLSAGQLFPCSTSPVQVSGLEGVTAMSGGEEHALALLGDGTVKAWGNNEFGQLGDGNPGVAQSESNFPVAVSGLCCATSVAAGGRHSLALENDGTVRTWGDNESGQLGNSVSTVRHPQSAVPVVVNESYAPLRGVVAVAAGEEHSLALLSDGEVRAWGNDESGQLGNDNIASKRQAIKVRGLRGPAVAIAAGEEHSLALLSDGTVMAWGSNSEGQLGDGTFTGPEECTYGACSRTPVPVAGLGGVVAIAAGGDHSLALLSNGTVMAWGENASGQLGNGTAANSDVPVEVKGLSGVVAISAGQGHSLALLSSGTVVSWGAGSEGQLGVGTSTGPQKCGSPGEEEACSTTPVAVSGLTGMDIKGIAAGAWHSLAFGPPNPTVTAVSPKGGLEAGGTVVTITGSEFTGATAVKFGSASATAFHVESNTSITAISPKGTGTVDVTVTTPEGTSPTSSADRFSYGVPTSGPAPTVSAVNPTEGPAQGGTTVTITGREFTGATAVKFGSSDATAFAANPEGTSITAVSPVGFGTVDVTVTTPSGTSATSSADQYSYRLAPPTVTAVSPKQGHTLTPTLVEITGTKFFHPTAVQFGGRPAERFLAVSDSTIVALAPPGNRPILCEGPEFVHVTVTTPGGTSATSPADEFEYGCSLGPAIAGGSSSTAATVTPRTQTSLRRAHLRHENRGRHHKKTRRHAH